MFQIHSFINAYHKQSKVYGPFYSDIDSDDSSVRVHPIFDHQDSFGEARNKVWFKSKLILDLETSKRSVDDEKSDFCKLANRMMYKMFGEDVPEELPDWSGLENRIDLVTKKKYVGNFRTET